MPHFGHFLGSVLLYLNSRVVDILLVKKYVSSQVTKEGDKKFTSI